MLYTLLAVAILPLLAILWSMKKFRQCTIPGPKPFPIIGNGAILKRDLHEFYKQLIQWSDEYSKEGGVFGVWFGMHLAVYVVGVHPIEKILSSTTLITKAFFYRFLKPWIGDGLLLSSGQKWHTRRKLLTPAFHFKILDIFRNSFNKHASKLVDELRKHKDTTFDIVPFMSLSALDIICETSLGVDINALENSDSDYVKAVHRVTKTIMNRSLNVHLWPDILFNLSSYGKEHNKCLEILHSFTKKVITDRREMKRDSILIEENTKPALLDLLLEAEESNKLHDEDIRDEVGTFVFEGHDTTSTALSWALFLIASHNDVQDNILNEITDVVGISQNGLTSSDLTKLKYLESVVKESLRLYPPVPLFLRMVTEPISLGGHDIPVGSTLVVYLPVTHRNAKYFPNPNKFDPSRWMEGSCGEKNPFSFLPFSAGMRNCIGQKFAMMEMKVILVWILRAFKISTRELEKDLLPTIDTVLRPKNGIQVYLEERN